MDLTLKPNTKMNTPDRVMLVEPLDDKSPLSSTGMVDTRLFTGENKLHAIMDTQTCLWSLRYDKGGLPPALRGLKFTGFNQLRKFCENYFAKRNIRIKEVI